MKETESEWLDDDASTDAQMAFSALAGVARMTQSAVCAVVGVSQAEGKLKLTPLILTSAPFIAEMILPALRDALCGEGIKDANGEPPVLKLVSLKDPVATRPVDAPPSTLLRRFRGKRR